MRLREAYEDTRASSMDFAKMNIRVLKDPKEELTNEQLQIIDKKALDLQKLQNRQVRIFEGMFISLLVTILLITVDIIATLLQAYLSYIRQVLIVLLSVLSYYIYKQICEISEKPILAATPSGYKLYVDKDKSLTEPIILGNINQIKPSECKNK